MQRFAYCTTLLLAALSLLLVGCDSNDDGGNGGGLGLGTLTARIDGDRFESEIAFARPCITCEVVDEGIEIAGLTLDGTAIAIGVVGFDGEGTYTLHQEGLGGAAVVELPDGRSFATDWEGGSGTLEVTDLTDDTIEGTFSFTALDGPDGESIEVTEGEFNLTLCETYDDPACFSSVPTAR